MIRILVSRPTGQGGYGRFYVGVKASIVPEMVDTCLGEAQTSVALQPVAEMLTAHSWQSLRRIRSRLHF